jgi:branched-subunit amino acid transport protein
MRLRPIAINPLMTVGLPPLAVNVLSARGVGVVNALVISALFPALAPRLLEWWRLQQL